MVDVPTTPEVQVTKGTGPDQLAQGDATLQNDEAARLARINTDVATQQAALPEPKYAKPTTGQVVTGNESDALFGPTQRPDEPITAGSGRGQFILPPAFLQNTLPALREAANSPDAPPALVNMLQLITYHLGQNGTA
jgi:hypothetical protein